MTETPRQSAQEAAVLLVAKGQLTLEAIARQLGIGIRTLYEWKATPEFQLALNSLLDQWRREIGSKGVADQRRRLFRLNDRWRRCQAVIEARAEEFRREQERIEADRPLIAQKNREALEAPEDQREWLLMQLPQDEPDIPEYAFTGLMVRRKKSVHLGEKSYETVWEYEVDTALLAEQRAIEQQAAQETGQWKQRVILEDPTRAAAELLADLMSEEEVADLEQRSKDDSLRGPGAEGDAGGRPGGPEPAGG